MNENHSLYYAHAIIKALTANGFKAFIVGGYVRDFLLKEPTFRAVSPSNGLSHYEDLNTDIDIATSARPEQVISLFRDHTVIPTGIAHGTVTVIINKISYEITTFRKDISTDGRNATICYANTIEEDLERRDFTMNAMALCPLTNTLIDPFNGQEAIRNNIIDTVGSPYTRFKEDFLRMFRALRFEATLGFTPSVGVLKSIKDISSTTIWGARLSVERIRLEIQKCFEKSNRPSTMFFRMHELGLLQDIMPELSACFGVAQNKHHLYDVFSHTLYTLDAVPKEQPLIRWAALFHDIGKVNARKFENGDYTFHCHEQFSAEIAENIMLRFKFSKKEIDYVINLVKHHMFQHKAEMKDSAIRRFIVSLGEEYIDDILILKYADRVGNGKKNVGVLDIESRQLKIRFNAIKKSRCAFKIKDLAVNGQDVMACLQIQPSPKVGAILKELFEAVIEDPMKNNREDLLALILKTQIPT